MNVVRFVHRDGETRTAVRWTGDNAAEVVAEVGPDVFARLADPHVDADVAAVFRPRPHGGAWRWLRTGDWLVLERGGWSRVEAADFDAYVGARDQGEGGATMNDG